VIFEVYDDSEDIYENEFDEDEARTTTDFKIEGSCSTSPGSGSGEASVIVSANLESGGFAGEELVIRASITNTGDESAELLLNAAGYSEWADSVSLSKDRMIIPSGSSDDLTLVFSVKSEAVGDQLFTLEVVSDNTLIASQPVSVSIEKKSTGLEDIFGDSWYLWLIGALNVILIIIIIVVAVKISRKK